MKRNSLFVPLFVWAFASSAAWAMGKSGNASTAFHAKGPAGLTIDGTTGELAVLVDDERVRVTVPLANLDTGINLRNKHMRDKYLEVGKYPTAELVVAKKAFTMPEAGSWTGDIPAMVSIHGVTKPVSVRATVTGKGAKFDVSGSFRVNMNDFSINVPTYLGVTLKPEIGIDSHFSVEDP